MNENQRFQEAKEVVNRSAELYLEEGVALMAADEYYDMEIEKASPTSQDAMKTGRAEDAWLEAREKSDQYAAENIDTIHEVANAEHQYRESENVYDEIMKE
jgi:hypothetical protein